MHFERFYLQNTPEKARRRRARREDGGGDAGGDESESNRETNGFEMVDK